MDDVIRVEDQYYILATSSLADDRTRVLKHGETFAVFDRYGDIQPLGLGEQGLYHEGTRFLSRQMLRLGRDRPLLLSSTVKDDNALLAVDLTNPNFTWDANMVSLLGKESQSRASASEQTDSAPCQLLPQPLVPACVKGHNLQACARLFSLSRVKARQFLLAFLGYLEQKRKVSSSRRLGNGNVALPEERGATP